MNLSKSARRLAATAAFAGVLASPLAFAQSVAVPSIVEHPALDSIKDGVRETLAAAGYTEAKGLKWQFPTAQGNTAIHAQIARKFIDDKPAVIVAIATHSAQALVGAHKNHPDVLLGWT